MKTAISIDDVDEARSLQALESALVADRSALIVGGDGDAVELPGALRTFMATVVRALKNGERVQVATEDQWLTTEEAASLLGVSRPTFVKRLEEGALPFAQPGAHRRIRLQDLMAYQENLIRVRREKLEWMTEQGQQERLDELSGEAYREVLEEIRHGR
ncbi:MAG: excisionase family DNA-binding protein [Actinomycetaceae bacterium]|nr:excisionase family DNA-binding protein [Actinomycetaceae bacterium]